MTFDSSSPRSIGEWALRVANLLPALLLAGAIVASCAVFPSSDASRRVSPAKDNPRSAVEARGRLEIIESKFRTQAIVELYTKARINHVRLSLFQLTDAGEIQVIGTSGSPLVRNVSSDSLDKVISFYNLRPNTNYRIRASAFESEVENSDSLISVPEKSFTDIAIKNDNLVNFNLGVTLKDAYFSGVSITNGIGITETDQFGFATGIIGTKLPTGSVLPPAEPGADGFVPKVRFGVRIDTSKAKMLPLDRAIRRTDIEDADSDDEGKPRQRKGEIYSVTLERVYFESKNATPRAIDFLVDRKDGATNIRVFLAQDLARLDWRTLVDQQEPLVEKGQVDRFNSTIEHLRKVLRAELRMLYPKNNCASSTLLSMAEAVGISSVAASYACLHSSSTLPSLSRLQGYVTCLAAAIGVGVLASTDDSLFRCEGDD